MIETSSLPSHDLLASYGAPPALIGTKPSASSATIFTGNERDLRHNCWIIRTADPTKFRGADAPVDFDHALAYGNQRLTDPAFDSELLTTKIVALEAMRAQYLTSLTTTLVPARLRHLVWLFRWRIDLGIDRTELITPAMFDDFCERLKSGLANTVALDRRFQRFEARISNEGWTWACRETLNGPDLNFDAVAAELGLSTRAFQTSALYAKMLKLVAATDPAIYGRSKKLDVNITINALDDEEGFNSTVDHAHKSLLPWRWLQELSLLGVLTHDRLSFDPFKDISIVSRARMIGRTPNSDEGRTGTPGPEQWLELLDGAARWVLEYSRPILAVCDEASRKLDEMATEQYLKKNGRNRRRIPWTNTKAYRNHVQGIIDRLMPANRTGRPTLLPEWHRTAKKTDRKSTMTLDEALIYTMTACLILIGGLSARRRGELESLQDGCADKDPFGNWWLSCYIEKTIRDIDRIPVPASIGACVVILEQLSLSTRQATGEPWITLIHKPMVTILEPKDAAKNGKALPRDFLKTRLDMLLDEFSEMIGVSHADDMPSWTFRPHQLRRAFSVYYYHGNRFASLDALSRFLRHFDPEMTRRYITEAIPGALMRMREIIESRQRLADAKSDRLLSQAREAAASLEDRSNVHEEVRQEAFVERVVEMYDGLENPIGLGAAQLYDELEEMVEKARIRLRLDGQSNISPDRERQSLIKILKDYAPKRFVEPHPGRHGHCGFTPGSSKADDAKCLQNKRAETKTTDGEAKPDYAFSSASDCLGCTFCVAFSENQAFIDSRISQLEQSAEKSVNEDGRIAAKAKLAEIKDKLAAAKLAVRGRNRG